MSRSVDTRAVPLTDTHSHDFVSKKPRLTGGSAPVMFGAGYVSRAEWWTVGFVMGLIYLGVWLGLGPLWWIVIGMGG